MIFKVTIIERFQKDVDIEADSYREACEIAESRWNDEPDYILDAENFAGVEFKIKEADE